MFSADKTLNFLVNFITGAGPLEPQPEHPYQIIYCSRSWLILSQVLQRRSREPIEQSSPILVIVQTVSLYKMFVSRNPLITLGLQVINGLGAYALFHLMVLA